MRRFQVHSGYQQFYVADLGLNSPAPEDWTEEHVAQRHNTLQHITALCPVGDITARIISCGPGETAPEETEVADFEVETSIEIPSGKLGVLGWPFELEDQYDVKPGVYAIFFKGYHTDRAEAQEDFYVVRWERREDI